MPRGIRASTPDKQKRQAEHIAEGYEQRGVSEKEAKRRAWATVNESSGVDRSPDPGGARRLTTLPPKRAGAKVGLLPPHVRRPNAPPLPAKPLEPVPSRAVTNRAAAYPLITGGRREWLPARRSPASSLVQLRRPPQSNSCNAPAIAG